MNLVVFGDSFVEGYTKAGNIEDNFVKLLGDYLDIETINVGFRGHGNVSISYDVLNYVRNNDIKDSAFLIVWSEWDRQYLVNDTRQMNEVSYLSGLQSRPQGFSNELLDHGVKRWQSEIAYNGVCNVLRDLNVPFLMISSQCNQAFYDVRIIRKKSERGSRLVTDQTPFKFVLAEKTLEEHWIEYPSTNNTLFDIITDNWLNKTNRHYLLKICNAQQNTEAYEYMTNDLHPNEEGHKLIAKTLEPYIRRIL